MECLAAFELFGLGRSQRDLVRFQTVPELLDELETFVRGQVRKIEWGRTHDANIGRFVGSGSSGSTWPTRRHRLRTLWHPGPAVAASPAPAPWAQTLRFP